VGPGAAAAAHLLDVARAMPRSLLNALGVAVEDTEPAADGLDSAIASEHRRESIQQRDVLYDKRGMAHLRPRSAPFIKSLRGSAATRPCSGLARNGGGR